MGIKGLSSFVRERFRGWLPVNFQGWSRVIIDGNNVCHTLYKQNYTWLLGGEYYNFRQTLEEFFKNSNFNGPIVVFDGADFDERKLSARERRVEAIQDMKNIQVRGHWDPKLVGNDSGPTPLMLIEVLKDVLLKLGIEIVVVAGEADNVIAALANHHKCPVLSSDSDFCVFNLEYGFIHFDRLYTEKNNNSLFKIQIFMSEFSLTKYELCLLIPCFFGNDFIKSGHASKPDEYSSFLSRIAESDTFLKDYRDKPENEKKFKKALQAYRVPDTEEAAIHALPWVVGDFKRGCFPAYLVSALSGKFFLPRVVEVIDNPSAWETSSYIRQYLYGFMGVSNVQEIIRGDCLPKISEKLRQPTFLKVPITIADPRFEHRNEELADLVLTVLKCHKIPVDVIERKFNLMEDKWKLPIAATFYWYHHKSTCRDIREDLLKSLLLSFLTCSDVISNDVPPLPPVNARTKRRHLTALHAFAKWQCVYYDAMALNYLAREPFLTTSPASLYSGKVVIHYATNVPHRGNWVTSNHFITDGSKEWDLFNKFLQLIINDSWTRITH